MTGFVAIFMGSRSDMTHAQNIINGLEKFGISAEVRVASAHKTPAYLLQAIEHYEADPRPKVYITIAGRSNALSGMLDAQVKAPVIACPPSSDAFGGADIFSSLRMPSGVAPVVILDAEGAALAAAKMLALADSDIRERVATYQQQMVERILTDDQSLQQTTR